MESSHLTSQDSTARISEQKWEQWRDFIRTEYLLNDEELAVVLDRLNSDGLRVKKAQLQHKVKQWGLRKNLTSETWRYVGKTIQKRKEAGKKSTVILSGRRLSSSKVELEIRRHTLVTLVHRPSPEPPKDDVSLHVCTPHSVYPSTTTRYSSLPPTLPWFQFMRTFMEEVLPSIELVPISMKKSVTSNTSTDGEYSLSRYARHGRMKLSNVTKSAMIQNILIRLTARTLQALLGSEEMSVSLVATHGVDWLSAQFARILPESYAEENLQRAAAIVNSNQSDQQVMLLKILIYLASNQLILDDTKWHNEKSRIQDAEAFVTLFRVSGLGRPSILRRLVSLSYESVSMMAVIEFLFNAAVLVEAVDIVSSLLVEDSCISTSATIKGIYWCRNRRWPPLHTAIMQESIDLIKVLINAEADVNQVTNKWPALAIAVSRPNREFSFLLAQLLLAKGASPDARVYRGPSVLQLSLYQGNLELASHLIALGADIWYNCPCSGTYLQSGGWITAVNPVFHSFRYIEGETSTFAFATSASYSGIEPVERDLWQHAQLYSKREYDERDEGLVIALINLLLQRSLSRRTPFQGYGADATIFAAMRGHTEVLSYLRNDIGQPVDSVFNSLSPIYAAVLHNQTKTCKQLLQWGVSSSIDERLRESWEYNLGSLPTLLHLAVINDSSELTKLLIEYGADIDLACEPAKNPPQNLVRTDQIFDCLEWDTLINYQIGIVSPLFTSVMGESWDLALLLLELGATPSGNALVVAASAGQAVLVEELLKRDIHPDEPDFRGRTAIEVAMSNGHNQISKALIHAGAKCDDLSLACIFSVPDITLVELFLKANSQSVISRKRYDGRSYLENAILCGEPDVTRAALLFDLSYYDSGSLCAAIFQEVVETSEDNLELTKTLVERREEFGYQKESVILALERTALSIAALNGRLDLIEILSYNEFPGVHQNLTFEIPKADHGYETEASNHLRTMRKRGGWHEATTQRACPLFFAIMGGYDTAIMALLDKGYKADIWTILSAIQRQIVSHSVQRLVESCDNINAQCYPFLPPLQFAVRKGNRLWVERLLDEGANINNIEDSPNGMTTSSLRIAAGQGYTDIVQLLLRNGADVNIGPESGTATKTALQIAVEYGYINIVQELLMHGANVNAQRHPSGHTCGTALEMAARNGRLDILHLLMTHGVLTEGYGRVQYVMAIRYAQISGHGAVVQTLRRHRPWSDEDEEILYELIEYPPEYSIFFHPKEYPEHEFANTVEEMVARHRLLKHDQRWWKNERLVDPGSELESEQNCGSEEDTSDHSTGSETSIDMAYTKCAAENEVSSATTSSDPQLASAVVSDLTLIKQPHVSDINRGEEVYVFNNEVETRLQSAGLAIDTTRIGDTSIRDGLIESDLENIEGTNERRQQILEDMLGIVEAPFQGSEWLW